MPRKASSASDWDFGPIEVRTWRRIRARGWDDELGLHQPVSWEETTLPQGVDDLSAFRASLPSGHRAFNAPGTGETIVVRPAKLRYGRRRSGASDWWCAISSKEADATLEDGRMLRQVAASDETKQTAMRTRRRERRGVGRAAADYEYREDSRGDVLSPGDYVSAPAHPRGTVRGWVTVSKRGMVVLPDGERTKALSLVDESGDEWSLGGKVTKMGKQLSPPPEVRIRYGGHDIRLPRKYVQEGDVCVFGRRRGAGLRVAGDRATKAMMRWAHRFPSFDEWVREYSLQGVRPVMWHLTNDPDFTPRTDIDPADVPLGAETRRVEEGRGGLMATAYPSSWAKGILSGDREYVAALDITALTPGRDYTVVGRGHDEIFIHRPGKVELIKVYKRKGGMGAARRMDRQYPQSKAEMREIWDAVRG